MQINELNSTIRTLIQELVDKGYKKKPICDVTLGSSFNPQFISFLEGTDLGLQPLSRLIEGLGFELHLIPLKKNDETINPDQLFESNYNEFMQTTVKDLTEYLDNRVVATRGSSPGNSEITKEINNTVDSIIEKIESETPNN